MRDNEISLIEIAKVFLIIGIIGITSWSASIALIQDYCVEKKKWLNNEEFSHGLALGQFLGPFVLNTTIFVGYRVRGFKGAMVALIVFLIPSIIYVISITFLYVEFHKIPLLHSALKGIRPVIVALVLSIAYKLGKNKLKSIETIFLILITIFLLLAFKIPVFVVILIALCYGFVKVKLLNLGECQ